MSATENAGTSSATEVEESLPQLIGIQRSLLLEEEKIIKMLEVIKNIKNKLQLEQLELDCMSVSNHLKASSSQADSKDQESEDENMEDADSDSNSCANPMNEKLDLSMDDILTSMTEGKFYAQEVSEVDSDEDMDYIQTLVL